MSLLARSSALYTYYDGPEVLFKASASVSSTTSNITLDVANFQFWTVLSVASSTTDVTLLKGNESGLIDSISVVVPLIGGSSSTSEFELVEYGVLFDTVISVDSTVGDIALDVPREFATTISVSSSVSDTVNLDAGRDLQAAVSATSTAQDAVLDILVYFAATIVQASSTTDIALVREAELATAVSASSVTDPIQLAVQRDLAMSLSVLSTVADNVLLNVARELVAAVAATSLTQNIGILVDRPWSASISAASDTTQPPLLKEISFGNMASTWGEQSPTEGERARPWSAWKLSGGGDIEISGDQSWGIAAVGSSDSLYSPVLFAGAGTHHFSLLRDFYGSGIGTVSLYIRGDTSSFGQNDGSPAWEAYTGPVDRTWTHVQMRIDG
jgi:hypothetical protein